MAGTAKKAAHKVEPMPGREDTEIEEAFERLVSEGDDRLQRPLVSLCATAFLGGIDVAVGVLAVAGLVLAVGALGTAVVRNHTVRVRRHETIRHYYGHLALGR